MSDPRYTDPRLNDPPQDEYQRNRIGELDKSNALWGWVAGGIVLALLLVFVFGRAPSTDQASTQMNAPPPGQSTLAPPSAPPTPPTAQRPGPSTTGQGSSQ